MKRILSFASLLAAAVMLISCEEKDKPINATGITLKCDKDIIKCDGNDASVLTVVADDGTVINEEVTFFDGEMNELAISDFKFRTNQEGTYTIWAAYKTFNSQQITIRAINADIPDVVADPAPSNASFVRRILINQFTGTGCPYCPAMGYMLRGVLKKEGFNDKIVITEVHSYNTDDPAYISSPNYNQFGATNPYLLFDMAVGYGDYTKEAELTEILHSRYEAEDAKVGISANPVFVEKLLPNTNGTYEDYLIARVSVKAAQTGDYTVGAWLLEDDIYGRQKDGYGIKDIDPDHDYDTHNNCVRVGDSRNGNSWIGYDLGTIQAGKTAEKTFLIRVKNSWKRENMHLAVFVGVKNADGRYSINNVVDCAVDAPTPFEYK